MTTGCNSTIQSDYQPDLFPYNSRHIDIKYEVAKFNDLTFGLQSYGDIAKWVFGWNGSDKTYIFADEINCIETNLSFCVEISLC